MKRWLRDVIRRPSNDFLDTIMPDMRPDDPFYAIGDIHGSTTLLTKILEQIAGARKVTGPMVFIGDYVDRGEDTAGTLAELYKLSMDRTRPTVFLRGNHEQMLLDFLDAPEFTGNLWLNSGGRHSLASYGILAMKSEMKSNEFKQLRDKFRVKLGENIEEWLRSLHVSWQSGNIFLSHAGADPTCGLDAQTNERLLWGQGSTPPAARTDGIWTVQGHVIVKSPQVVEGQVFIDTGAYATHKLTAARFDDRGVTFLST
jgi:serine/threonine protein phosphatase 1